jgi:hypothetical protein
MKSRSNAAKCMVKFRTRSRWSAAAVATLLVASASAQEARQGEVSAPSSAPQNEPTKSVGVTSADAQSPLASVVSVPFQDNTYFDAGPYKGTVNALLVQPVVPFKLGDNWEVISRTIMPIIYAPRTSPSNGATFGLGNVQPQFYLTPAHPGSVIWGVGPQLWLPTATDKTLGNNHFGAGPAAVVLAIRGHWLYGFLANQVWAGNSKGRTNQFTFQPFVFYNMAHGWYLTSTPVATAQWEEAGRNVWTVPVGGGAGRLFKVGSQPINMRFEAFNNVHRPDYAPSWQVQFQIQFLFPKH